MISVSARDTLSYAREALSGKRAALIGFAAATAAELTQIISEADAFARPLSLEVRPSADLFKPFELILINIESAADTDWLKPEELSNVTDRCIAVGHPPVHLMLLAQSQVSYREFCVWPGMPEEVLLRCVLALRPGPHPGARALPLGSTIVLADDDPSITALVRLTLQRNGLTCEVASNGGDALELIKKLRPCAAVLDVNMPNIDGFEVLSRMRSLPEVAQTRVILLTGCEQEMHILRGFRLGADDYVIKPFNPMELMMRLKRVIGRL
ncbi:MAG: response regulator [Bryobacteraceae bacterium]